VVVREATRALDDVGRNLNQTVHRLNRTGAVLDPAVLPGGTGSQLTPDGPRPAWSRLGVGSGARPLIGRCPGAGRPGWQEQGYGEQQGGSGGEQVY